MIGQPTLWRGLVDDAAMFPPGNAEVAEAVSAHLGYRLAWFRDLIGPLVVPDQRLAEVGRALGPDQPPLAVSVINTGGAGGMLSLARREIEGVEVIAVESALRDLDDLAGNAARVVAAAGELDETIRVFVEIPYVPGWERAVEVLEAAGLLGKIRTGNPDNTATPTYDQLVHQLNVLVEADLPFKATAGLHHAWRSDGADPARPRQHGFLNLLAAIEALIEGADVTEAVDLLARVEREELGTSIAGWGDATAAKVRRRLVSFGCCGVHDPVEDLVGLRLVERPA